MIGGGPEFDMQDSLAYVRLRNKGCIIFKDIEEVAQTTENITFDVMIKMLDRMADNWEFATLTRSDYTFNDAILALRTSAVNLRAGLAGESGLPGASNDPL